MHYQEPTIPKARPDLSHLQTFCGSYSLTKRRRGLISSA